jgi:hypothetical protein
MFNLISKLGFFLVPNYSDGIFSIDKYSKFPIAILIVKGKKIVFVI